MLFYICLVLGARLWENRKEHRKVKVVEQGVGGRGCTTTRASAHPRQKNSVRPKAVGFVFRLASKLGSQDAIHGSLEDGEEKNYTTAVGGRTDRWDVAEKPSQWRGPQAVPTACCCGGWWWLVCACCRRGVIVVVDDDDCDGGVGGLAGDSGGRSVAMIYTASPHQLIPQSTSRGMGGARRTEDCTWRRTTQ